LAVPDSLDFGTLASRMIMVGFGDQLAAPDHSAVETAPQDIREGVSGLPRGHA
jgi:hypothetical protein